MILTDTGFFLALIVRTDIHHGRAVAALQRHAHEGLMTTWPVLCETLERLQSAGASPLACALLASVEAGAVRVFELEPEHLRRMIELMGARREPALDLADASLWVCAEATGEHRILSAAPHSATPQRWKRRKPFKNLLTA